MKTYNQFINEGVRDLMTGKSIEDAKKSIDNLPPQDRYVNISKYKLQDIYTEEELNKFLKDTNPTIKFNIGINKNKFWLVKEGINEDSTIIRRFNHILPSVIRRCDNEIIKYLVDLGFNTNTDNSHALQLVTIDGDYEKVKILIDGGAKPTTDILEIALNKYEYNQDIVDLLLKNSYKYAIDDIKRWGYEYRGKFRPKGAYPYIEESVRHLMTPKSEEQIFNYLKDLNQNELDVKLLECVRKQLISWVKVLLDLGANPNYKNRNGNTTLFTATVGGITTKPNIEIIKILLDNGADPTISNNRGAMTLKYAEVWKNWEIVDLLKKYIKPS
jgi:hypothetical protein